MGIRVIKDPYHREDSDRDGFYPAGRFAMTAMTGLMHVAVSDSLLGIVHPRSHIKVPKESTAGRNKLSSWVYDNLMMLRFHGQYRNFCPSESVMEAECPQEATHSEIEGSQVKLVKLRSETNTDKQ